MDKNYLNVLIVEIKDFLKTKDKIYNSVTNFNKDINEIVKYNGILLKVSEKLNLTSKSNNAYGVVLDEYTKNANLIKAALASIKQAYLG